MKTYENDYTDYFIERSLTQDQIDRGIKFGPSSGIFQSFVQMLKHMNERGQDGWQIVSAWQRTEFVNFCISIVWQREV